MLGLNKMELFNEKGISSFFKLRFVESVNKWI